MPMIAGKAVTLEQVRGTLWMLRYYREFLRSNCERCPNPEDRQGNSLTKDQARRRLAFLINVALNRKAGIDGTERPIDIELWRDCQLVQHLIHRNNPSGLQWRWHNMRKFRTDRIQKRYGHLLKPDCDTVCAEHCGPRWEGKPIEGSYSFRTLENGQEGVFNSLGERIAIL